MISCECCQEIINEITQTDVDPLFDESITNPDFVNGVTHHCEKCGRTWTLVVTTLDFDGDLIPEGAVEVSDNKEAELTELGERERLDEFNESLESHFRNK